MTRTSDRSGGHGVTVALFMALFAGQAAVIALSPVLADAASDLHVSTAAAGQLRTITGLAAGVTAVGLGAVGARIGLGRQLLAASALLALGSLANAAWAGTLVYAGALFAESYGTSTGRTGCLLAVSAIAYVAGNLACRRLVRREARGILILLALSLSVTDALFGIVRSDVGTSTALL